MCVALIGPAAARSTRNVAFPRKLLWFFTGLLAATLLAGLMQARPVAAQTIQPKILPPKAGAGAAQPRRQTTPVAPGPADEPGYGESSSFARETETPDDARSTAATEAPLFGETEDAQRRAQPRLPAGMRAAIRDGDLKYPEAEPPRDGVIETGEPSRITDGLDPESIDARPPEDLAAFDPAPSAPDALLFPIEDLEPLRDRRTDRFARLEPYDPVGVRVGSFILYPEAELAGVGYSNVLRSIQPRSDVALEAKPMARLVSDWRAHAIELRASGAFSFHNAFPGEDDRFHTLEARGRLDVTRQTNLQALYSHQSTQESRTGIDARRIGARADISTDQIVAALNHRFNRLSLQLRGGVTDSTFTPTLTPDGGIASNRERNMVQTDQSARATWEFKPALSAFAEGTLVQRDYAAAPAGDGILRNTDGERLRVGLSFGETGEILRGEASIGWGRQRPQDARLGAIDAFLLDANAAWRVTPRTSLLFTARSDILETNAINADGVVTRTAGIEARHAFLRNLIASAGVQVTRADYHGIVLDETETAARLGAEYYLNREVTIFTRYQHIWFDSSDRFRDYEADEVRVGVRVRR